MCKTVFAEVLNPPGRHHGSLQGSENTGQRFFFAVVIFALFPSKILFCFFNYLRCEH